MTPNPDVLFMCQVVFSLIFVIFSIIMLATGHDTSVYLPILTSIAGYWTPSPRLNSAATMITSQFPGGVQTVGLMPSMIRNEGNVAIIV